MKNKIGKCVLAKFLNISGFFEIQSNFIGSNTFGTMKISSRQG